MTNKAEIVARSVAKDCCFRNKEHVRRKILNYIMKAKVEDAEDVVKAEDYKHYKMKKELSKEIPNTDILRFQRFCHEEAELEWGKKKEKDEKKREHLVKKHKGKGDGEKDTIEEVKVSDKALGPTRPLPEASYYNIDVER